jgi:hypothetical protein
VIDWLAIIVVCSNGHCAFWADTKTPYESKAACEKVVVEMSQYFTQNNAEPVMAGCLPIKFLKV